MTEERPSRRSTTTIVVRYVLPAVVVLGGIITFVVNPSLIAAEGAAGVIGAGLAIYLFNWLFRVSMASEHDRDDEAAARDYFDRHGRWPDEAPPTR
jgi:hypothetical protein